MDFVACCSTPPPLSAARSISNTKRLWDTYVCFIRRHPFVFIQHQVYLCTFLHIAMISGTPLFFRAGLAPTYKYTYVVLDLHLGGLPFSLLPPSRPHKRERYAVLNTEPSLSLSVYSECGSIKVGLAWLPLESVGQLRPCRTVLYSNRTPIHGGGVEKAKRTPNFLSNTRERLRGN